MVRVIRNFRGLKADLPSLEEARIAFTTDTKETFIGSDSGNVKLAKQVDVDNATTKLAQLKKIVSTASRGKWYDKSSNGTDVDITYRSMHEALCDFTGLSLMYGNFNNDERATGLNAYTLNVSIDVGGFTYPVLFNNGELSKIVKPSARVWSDVVGISIKKGERFFVRTHVLQIAGEKHPTGLTVCGSWNSGEGIMAGDATIGTFTTANVNPLYALTPLVIYGKPSPITGNFKTVGLCGDSISGGTGNSNTSVDGHPTGDTGFMQTGALRAGWGYVHIGMNGQKAADFAYPPKRANRLQMVKDCDLVIVEYGTNDFLTTSRTFEQIKADLLTIHQTFWAMGIPTVQTTIAPQTASTDVWVTLANQTPINSSTAGGEDSTRSKTNNWIRSNTDGVRCIETADVWESGRNSGLWRVTPVSTSDGVHPNTYGHNNDAANLVRDFLLIQ